MKNKSLVKCAKCKKKADSKFGAPNLIFANPKDTSKWDNFSYRAGFNMEKAKGERRAAEAEAKGEIPYQEINDFNTKGVFDKGGASIQRDDSGVIEQ
jgi:hypothetical protein